MAESYLDLVPIVGMDKVHPKASVAVQPFVGCISKEGCDLRGDEMHLA